MRRNVDLVRQWTVSLKDSGLQLAVDLRGFLGVARKGAIMRVCSHKGGLIPTV